MTVCLSALTLLVPALGSQERSSDLYGQSTAAELNRRFPSDQVEYLLLDVHTRQTIAYRWHPVDQPIPVGSLIKPFLALAFSQIKSEQASPQRALSGALFPMVQCHGKADGCWRAAGHGSLSLELALAKSCNAYFLALASSLATSSDGPASLNRVSAAYGLPTPPWPGLQGENIEQATTRMLIGLTPEWRISPIALARAYATLGAQSRSEVVIRVLRGMRLAASPAGTAARLARFVPQDQNPGGILAKTGTAPCISDPASNAGRCIANGNGLVVVLAPAENPRFVLLVRQRATTGAQTAEVAGRMLALLEVSHAPAR